MIHRLYQTGKALRLCEFCLAVIAGEQAVPYSIYHMIQNSRKNILGYEQLRGTRVT